jgi:ankyrin repeat protein
MTGSRWFCLIAAALLLAGGCGKKPPKPTTPLHRAAKKGDLAKVQMLIARGADLNARDDRGRTPLYLAAQAGHKDVIEILARCGARVDSADNYGSTPMALGMWQDRREMVECLIRAGATRNLDVAIYLGDIEQVRRLIDRGININGEKPGGWTPLHWAVRQGRQKVVELLVASGADVNRRSSKESLPCTWRPRKRPRGGAVSHSPRADVNARDHRWMDTAAPCGRRG